jgi:murein DD-endopeptidase MepM/ murein hydrolase activator NlpD
MGSLAALAALLVASQGDAVPIQVPHEPGLEQVVVDWEGVTVSLTRQSDRWLGLLGIDLDAEPGERELPLKLTFADGRSVDQSVELSVQAREFPTTELQVAPRFVDLNPNDQARAALEAEEIAEIYRRVTHERLWDGAFAIPVAGVQDGRNFGHRRVFNGQARAPHSGADLRAGSGTPITAANSGRVVLAKDLFFSGNAVFLDHGMGVYSVYLHLSEIHVEPGQMLAAGQVLGLAGATGRVTGPHLHWGVRIQNARVDPFSLTDRDLN